MTTGLLHLEGTSGQLTLTAAMSSNSEITASVTTTVNLPVSAEDRWTDGSRAGNMDNGNGAPGSLTLYPNPATNFITIEWSEAQTLGTIPGSGTPTASVYNLSGIRVMQFATLHSGEQMDISNLSSGIYLLEVQTPQGVFRKKFIKQ